jgi:hypothetical protein
MCEACGCQAKPEEDGQEEQHEQNDEQPKQPAK